MSKVSAPISAFAAAQSRKRKRHASSSQDAPHQKVNGSADISTAAPSEPGRQNHEQLIESKPRVKLTSFDPASRLPITHSEGTLSFRMTKGENAAFIGVYDLTVGQGAVQLMGAVLIPASGTHRVYSSALSAVPDILCLSQDCVVTLRACKNYLGRFDRLSKLYRSAFPLCSAVEARRANPYSASLGDSGLYCARHNTSAGPDVDLSPLRCPAKWIQAFETVLSSRRATSRPASLSSQHTVFVCGAKKTGKSTFCRALINHALTKPAKKQLKQGHGQTQDQRPSQHSCCFLLDLDPGQPETTAPGLISLAKLERPLLGDPLTSPSSDGITGRQTIRMHTIADSSPQNDEEQFMRCVADLYRCCRQAIQHHPNAVVIINTPGWITGRGLDLMTELLKITEPTATVIVGLQSLHATTQERNVIRQALNTAAAPSTVIEIASEAPKDTLSPARYTAAERRAMLMQSYFHLKRPSEGHPRWTAMPLTSAYSYPLKLRYGSDGTEGPDVLGLVSLYDTPDSGFIVPWIHRTVIAVCTVEDAEFAAQMREAAMHTPSERVPYLAHSHRPRKSDEQVLVPPDPARSRTLALAFVKDVDTQAQTITLLTPAHLSLRNIVQAHRDATSSQATEQEASEQGANKPPNNAIPPRLFLVAGRFDPAHWAYAENSRFERYARACGAEDAAAAVLEKGKDGGERMYVSRRDLTDGRRSAVWRAGATARFARRKDEAV